MIVTEFDPTSTGIDAAQLVVPAAVPAEPVLVFQVILATPALSERCRRTSPSGAGGDRSAAGRRDGERRRRVSFGAGAGVGVGVGAGVGVGVGAGVGVGVGVGSGAGAGCWSWSWRRSGCRRPRRV